MIFFNKIYNYFKRAYLLGHYPSIFKVIFSAKKKIIYYGFLGDKNFGDELVFTATKSLFKDAILIPYLRHMPFLLKFYCDFFVNSIHGIVIGGGTLIRSFNSDTNYFNKLIAKGKPIFYHGTGVDKLEINKEDWLPLLKIKTHGGLRGKYSKQTLKNIDIDKKIIGDAALYMHEKPDYQEREKTVIVNFGTHNKINNLDMSRKEIAKFLNSDYLNNYNIIYLPFHKIDYEIGLWLKNKVNKIKVLEIAVNFKETHDLMSKAEFCIGERLHFIVMAVLSNTNFLSINYHEKHVDFLSSLELENKGFDAKKISHDLIFANFENKYNHINWIKVNKQIEKFKRIGLDEQKLFMN